MAITAAKLLIWVGADSKEADQAMDRISQKINGFGDTAMRVGRNLTAWVTTPLLGVGVAATKVAADFDRNMNVLQATTGATAGDMELLRRKAQELGADLTLPGASAANAAEAMLELSKAGLDVNETLTASRGVLQLAAAGQLSNAQAAEIAANALNAFKLEGDQAVRVADLLAAAANASSGDVTDMADSLKMASAVASSARIPIEDVVTAISLMANAGIKGSDAGTSLKQMLLALQAPSKKASELMGELGIHIYDMQGNMLPMPDLIEQFSSKLGGLTQEQRNMALATIFGSDAVRAANVILMGGVDAYDAMKVAVTDAGAAADLAAAQTEGLGGAFQKVKSAVTNAMIAGVLPFQDEIVELANRISEAAVAFSELDEGTQETIVGIGLLAAGIGPANFIVGMFAKTIGGVISVIGGIAGAVQGAIVAFQAWQAGLSLTTALGAAGLSPMAITLGAIALAVGSVVAVWATWNEKIVETNREGAKAVSDTWTQFFDDQADAGKNATQVVDAYLAAQQRTQDVLNNANPIVRLFISNQAELTSNYAGLSEAVSKAAGDYGEYEASLRRAAEANGLVIDAEGNLIRRYREGQFYRTQVVQANYLLDESEFKLSQTQELVNKALYEGTQNGLAYSGAANDVGVAVAGLEQAAAAAAPAVDALGQEVAEAAAAALEAGDIISILNQALTDADWSTQAVAMSTQELEVALGTLDAAQAQLKNDVTMLAQAFASGVISGEQFNQFMVQAKDGTLALSQAQRDQIQASIDQAKALSEAAEAAKSAAIEQLNLAQSLKDATDAQIANAAITMLGQEYEKGGLSFESYVEAVGQVQETFGLADAKSRALAAGLQALTSALTEGALPAQSYDEALQALITDAQDGTVDIQALLAQFAAAPGQIQPATTSVDTATQALDNFGIEAKDAAQEAKTAAADIEKAFTSPDWRGLGEDIAAGIAAGIRSGTDDVAQAAADAAAAALEAAETESQTQSPSKKFMELSKNWMAGMQVGVRDNADGPIQETVSATRKVLSQTQETMSDAPGGQNGQFVEQIVSALAAARGGQGQMAQITINVGGEELRRVIVSMHEQELAA